MRVTKKTAPDVEAIESGTGNRISGQAIGNPSHNSTMSKSGPQEVSSLLLVGERNALKLSYLAAVAKLDPRTIRQRIQRERLNGIPILSNCRSGYFLPESEEERNCFVKSMLHRAAEIEKAARAIAAAEVPDA